MEFPKYFEISQEEYDELFSDTPYFCGDVDPHPSHDDKTYWLDFNTYHTCSGTLPLIPIEQECGS